MRTTLTLDPDVAALVEQIRRERGASLRDVVNDGLRAGLGRGQTAGRTPFHTRTVSLGRPRLSNVDDVADVIKEMESEADW